MKYVYAQLKGGLGNQLFIYAHAKSISVKQNRKLVLDTFSGFINDEKYKRTYELEKFCISPDNLISNDKSMFSRKRFKRIFLFLSKCLPKSSKFYVAESSLGFDSALLGCGVRSKHLYIDGYWQSEKYFEAIKEIIYNDFQLRIQVSEDIVTLGQSLRESNSVSVHVRKFVNDSSNYPNNLNMDYYERSFKLIEQKVDNPIYYIFSEPNAIDSKLRAYFSNKSCIFIADLASKLTTENDFYLMSKCNHYIIANSTFSWWSAWLGEQSSKTSIVVAPKIFIDVGPSGWGFDGLIPDRWIQT